MPSSSSHLSGSDRPLIHLHTTVNGKKLDAIIEPNVLLLDFLRNHLGLTGAKLSCDAEICGACTVLLDGVPVSSCSTLAYETQGRSVLTIEGVEQDGQLHPVQQAFIQNTAIQCGFCTPGMVLTLKSLLDENPHPTSEEVRDYLRGNLCRCTGYWNILKAAQDAARMMDSAHRQEEKRL